MNNQAGYYSIETGKPAADIACKPGAKNPFRKATVADARKHGWLIRTTSISAFPSNFQLSKYFVRQHVMACMTKPWDGTFEGMTEMKMDAAIKAYQQVVEPIAKEHASNAADAGTAIHKAIYLNIGDNIQPEDAVHADICGTVNEFMLAVDATDVNLEWTVISKEEGVAGTPDFSCYADTKKLWAFMGWDTPMPDVERVHVIVDFKSVDFKKYREPYTEQKLQLGGYHGLTRNAEETTVLVNMACDRATGQVRWFMHEHSDMWWSAFKHCRDAWCIINKYDPRTWEA